MQIIYKNEVKDTDTLTSSQILELLLKNRKIENKDNFISPPSPLEISLLSFHPDFKTKFETVIALLKKIYEEKKMIVVYTDYDADGITGGAILWETLHLLGFKVMPYVPNRHTEGYGFSYKGIDTIIKDYNPSLIISVDHGITAAEKVKYAKEKGVAVVITDHHLKPDILPDDAVAIFHISELSGSGVSYFFSKEIFNSLKDTVLISPSIEKLKHNFEVDYLTLASIGTIADLVPLVGASRSIVKYGLDACMKLDRCGLKHLLKEAGIEGKKITPYEVGFIIAPRINAIGRLQHAIDALRLLCTTDSTRAAELAGSMGDRNRERQDLVKEGVTEAVKMVQEMQTIPNIIILTSDHWNEGIIGLISSKITEKYYRPSIIMTKSDGFYKASSRSIPSFHITNFLRGLKDHLVDVGGHSGAAGFTIKAEKLEGFIEEVSKQSPSLFTEKDLERTIEVDMKAPLSLINLKLALLCEQLQPFGIGNSQPTFYSTVQLLDAKVFGKKNEHLKIMVKYPQKQMYPLELIAFGKADTLQELKKNGLINIVYTVEVDRWTGTERLRGRLIQIV
jgi:single-stranded-DNA-specific exonuclease